MKILDKIIPIRIHYTYRMIMWSFIFSAVFFARVHNPDIFISLFFAYITACIGTVHEHISGMLALRQLNKTERGNLDG